MDEKLVMFREPERWKRALDKMAGKGMSADIQHVFSDYKNILAVSDMIVNEEYEPAIPRIVRVPKDNGKVRELTVLPELDRAIFGVIADIYYELYAHMFHKSCVSYQRGIAVPNVVHEISHKVSLGGFKADISKFFDSVPEKVLLKNLEQMHTCSAIDKVVLKYYCTDLVIDGNEEVRRYKSLSQGCAISGILANLVLRDIDKYMSEHAAVYYRYSDDILLLDKNSDKLLKTLTSMLHNLGLDLNPDKVTKIDANATFDFLGTKISLNKTQIGSKPMKKLKAEVKSRCKHYKKHDATSCRKAIKYVQRYLLQSDALGHRAFDYYCQLCTHVDCITEFDNYCKDTLRAVCTGKHVPTTNAKVDLKKMGWVSLTYLYNLYKMDYNAYNVMCNSILVGVTVSTEIENTMPVTEVITNLENLWEGILEYKSPKNIFLCRQADTTNCEQLYLMPEFASAAYRQALSLLNQVDYNTAAPFVRSTKYPELCVLGYWYS